MSISKTLIKDLQSNPSKIGLEIKIKELVNIIELVINNILMRENHF